MLIIESAMNAGPVSVQQQILDTMNYLVLFSCLFHNIINGTTKVYIYIYTIIIYLFIIIIF